MIIMKIREDNPTKLIEVNFESTGFAQEDPFFFDNTDQQDTTEKEICKRKEKTRNALPIDPPVITISCFYAYDLHKDTTIVSKAHFTKPSRIFIEQVADPTLLYIKHEMFGLPFDEQVLTSDIGYMHCSRNKKRINI